MSLRKIIRTSLVILPFLFSSFPVLALASSWEFGYHNISQFRKGPPGKVWQAPVYQYFDFGFSGLPRDISFVTDFQVFADPKTGANSNSLYQADLHIQPVDGFSIDGGRLFIMDGFNNDLIDGLNFELRPEKGHFGGKLYAGFTKFMEQGSFQDLREGLLVGLDVALFNVKDTAATFSAKWRKLSFKKNDYNYNDTIYLGLAGSRQFSSVWSTPKIYGDVEVDVAGKTVDVATLGLEAYPHWRIALTLEGNRFDVARKSREHTVFGDYLSGSIMQGREAMQIKLMKSLHFVENFTYSHYTVKGSGGKSSYMLSAALDHFWDAAKLSTYAEFYYTKSYGGNVYGGYLDWGYKYFKKVFMDLGVDISSYSKITNQKKTAASVVADIGYSFFNDRCFLALGGEVNHSDWYSNEQRLTINFQLNFEKGEYTPEKRSKRVNRKFHEI